MLFVKIVHLEVAEFVLEISHILAPEVIMDMQEQWNVKSVSDRKHFRFIISWVFSYERSYWVSACFMLVKPKEQSWGGNMCPIWTSGSFSGPLRLAYVCLPDVDRHKRWFRHHVLCNFMHRSISVTWRIVPWPPQLAWKHERIILLVFVTILIIQHRLQCRSLGVGTAGFPQFVENILQQTSFLFCSGFDFFCSCRKSLAKFIY